MNKLIKPIFYYSVLSNNIGDKAIRKAIIEYIKEQIDVPICYLNVRNDELTENRIIKQLNNESSALIIAGGGLYCNINCSSGWYFPCNTNLFNKIEVPIILLGIGYNSHLKGDNFKEGFCKETQQSIITINNLAELSTVRDKRTYDLLKGFGINNHQLILDPACFLKYNKQDRIKRVAINIAQHAPILGRYDGTQIYRQKNIENFAKICEELKRRGYEVIYIAFDPLEQSIIQELKTLFPDLLYLNTDNIDKILEEYSRCMFSIGMKMHSNILSFAVNTPFISVYYDKKSIEFLKMINWESFGFSIFEDYFNKTLALIDLLDIGYLSYSKIFKQIQETEKPKFIASIDKVCKIIKNNGNYTAPPITVLMPTYNREKYIRESIVSILNQTYTNFTLLIYDDGSTDNTISIIKELQQKDNRVKLIRGEINKGGLYAKQKLLDLCETEIATWLDSDDLSLPTRLEEQVGCIKKFNLVFTKWNWLKYTKERWTISSSRGGYCLDSMMFRIDKSIRMNETKLWGSKVWFKQMMEKYPKHIEINKILYTIRDHNDRVTRIKQIIEKLISKNKITSAEIFGLNMEQLKEFIKRYE